MQSDFLLELKALGKLDKRAHHLGYQGGPKKPPHIFFVLTNLDCFDLGTSLSESNVLSQGYYAFVKDRQTD